MPNQEKQKLSKIKVLLDVRNSNNGNIATMYNTMKVFKHTQEIKRTFRFGLYKVP